MRTKILLTMLIASFAFGQKAEDTIENEERFRQAIQYAKDSFVKSLEQQLRDALNRYTDKHPEIVALKKELERMKAWNPPVTPFLLSRMTALPDQWWKDPEVVKTLGLTPAQQKRLGDILDQYRNSLIERNAALEQSETELASLMAAGSRDDKKITEAIDSVAQNRAELEKVRGRMLLAMRNQLTPEQWNKISHGPALTRR